MDQIQISSYVEFYRLLEKQYEYLYNGGTDYRIKTAELSLDVAKKYNQIQPFLDMENAKIEVKKHFPNIDEERLNDVSKMLYANAREVNLKSKQPPEFKKMIREKAMKARNNYKLVRNKK